MGKLGDRLRRRYQEQQEARNMPATRSDVRRLTRQVDSGFKRSDPGKMSNREMGQRTVRMVRRGFADIGKSLNTPSAAGHRPKISQMPGRRRDIGISRTMGLDGLKMPGMRNMSLTWAPGWGKKKKRRR